MKASILLALAAMGSDIVYSAPTREPIYLGKVPNKKKRFAMSKKECERRFVTQPSKPHKTRNKKGRP